MFKYFGFGISLFYYLRALWFQWFSKCYYLFFGIECGVAYQSNLKEVKALAIGSIAKIYPPQTNEDIEFHYLNFGDSSIDFQLRFWVNATANLSALEAKSEAIIALKEAFDENSIEIPYPVRTIIRSDSMDID